AYEAFLTGADEARSRGAFTEALQGYEDALDIVKGIADQGTRDLLKIRCLLQRGVTTIAAIGFSAQSAVEDLTRCQELCRALGPRPEHLTVIASTFGFHITRGELHAARRIAEDFRSLVDGGHTYYRAESIGMFGVVSFYEGDYQLAKELFDLAINQFTRR